jgi:hypothetical protein
MAAVLDAGAADAADRLVALAAGRRAVASGPGMATGPEGGALVATALARLELPLVIDADGRPPGRRPANRGTVSIGRRRRRAGGAHPPGRAARLLDAGRRGRARDRVSAVHD